LTESSTSGGNTLLLNSRRKIAAHGVGELAHDKRRNWLGCRLWRGRRVDGPVCRDRALSAAIRSARATASSSSRAHASATVGALGDGSFLGSIDATFCFERPGALIGAAVVFFAVRAQAQFSSEELPARLERTAHWKALVAAIGETLAAARIKHGNAEPPAGFFY
jgi:hypothetical protein